MHKEEALAHFRSFHPVFEVCWKEAVKLYEEVASSMVFDDLATEVCKLLVNDPDFNVIPIIDFVEKCLREGNEELKTIICTYFIESLLSSADRHPEIMAPVLRALGPLSRDYALGWNEFVGCTNRGL